MSSAADHISAVQRYYSRWETDLGFRLLLGNTSHHGYYAKKEQSAFPLHEGLHRLEKLVRDKLSLRAGDTALDAGCGAGSAAITMANHGVLVDAVDILPEQVKRAKKAVAKAGVSVRVRCLVGDYQSSNSRSYSYNAVYCIESLGQAYDAAKCLENFYRVLKPGGKIAIADFETNKYDDMDTATAQTIAKLGQYVAGKWPEHGSYEGWLRELGFEDVEVTDLSENIMPLGNFFHSLAAIPYALVIKPFGLAKHFPNTFAAQLYSTESRKAWKYKIITARKPNNDVLAFTRIVKYNPSVDPTKL